MHKCIIWITWKAVKTSVSRVRTRVYSLVFLWCFWTKSHIHSYPCHGVSPLHSLSASVSCWGISSVLYSHMAGLPPLHLDRFLQSSVISLSFLDPTEQSSVPHVVGSLLCITALSLRARAPQFTCLHQNWYTSELDGNSVLWGILELFQLGK